ncbi:DUF4446 family protein [Candidatus Parcubacteria bacterium]|nr:DUF4446 family protein [Candidatus Parcubacteria bacterium]
MPIEDFFNFDYVIFYLAFGTLLLLVFTSLFYTLKQKKRLDIFFQKGEKDLEKILVEQIKKTEKIEKNLEDAIKQISELEKNSQRSFQKIGIIRFNPFKEVGGDQSFAIALLDLNNNGFVITSHYGRESNRVYTKEIKNGKSKYSLSNEEEKAIKQAVSGV